MNSNSRSKSNISVTQIRVQQDSCLKNPRHFHPTPIKMVQQTPTKQLQSPRPQPNPRTSSPLPQLPPPPPPPPLPNWSNGFASKLDDLPVENGHSTIELLDPIGSNKPSMKMRTLNWRKIPKRKVLQKVGSDQSVSKASKSISSTMESQERSSFHENIWFLIAKRNSAIKETQPPVEPGTSKSASRIREMLESVKRRMANVSTIGQAGEPLAAENQASTSSILKAIDFQDLQSLFCLENQPFELCGDFENSVFVRRSSMRTNASSDSVISSNESNNGDDSLTDYENILSSKKSLNINIFLKQVKSTDELVSSINKEDHSSVGKEKLENLLKLLPDKVETSQLMKCAAKNRESRLPVAERFLFQLITRVPNLQLRIKFMILLEEYNTDLDAIREALGHVDSAIEEIKGSQKFRDLLGLVLITGNFLNSGSYAADAAGFSLDCLSSLSEVRSNKPNVYLIHYVADVAEKLNLVNFQREELAHVEVASRVCIDSIRSDLSSMMEKIIELEGGLKKVKETSETLKKMQKTLDSIAGDVEFLKLRSTSTTENSRRQLASYLCEDVSSFQLHDCFKQILNFSQKLRIASEENLRRRLSHCNLRRSNTINTRLMRPTQGRYSLGCTSDLTAPQGQKESNTDECPREQVATNSDARIESRRITLGTAQARSGINQSTLSRTTSTFNISSSSQIQRSTKQSEYEELHEGLLRVLANSNIRLPTGSSKCYAFGSTRRASRIIRTSSTATKQT